MIEVLNHGHVRLVDSLGSDLSIVRAARISYAAEWRTGEDAGKDEKLIDYLVKNRHCYHPDMEVLTASGWKKWGECGPDESFVVPDPFGRTVRVEKLPVLSFDVHEETMCTMSNTRMSYCVTSDHRLWVKPKKFLEYRVEAAGEFKGFGNFDPLKGYALHSPDGEKSAQFQLVGFYLGDGSYSCANRICFHLKKQRKKDYLEGLLNQLGVQYDKRLSSTYSDANTYWVHTPDWFKDILGEHLTARAGQKDLAVCVCDMDGTQVRGLLDGLISSDGAISKERPQISYSSTSPALLRLFETLCTFVGIDAHARPGRNTMISYIGDRNTLECRSQFLSKTVYTGKVMCATTSTGLLLVRGGPDKFAFVCGNTSPLESVVFTFDVKAPIFVFRQWHRHRTWSFSEISARYSELPEQYYVPEISQITTQSKDNKQMRTEVINPNADSIQLALAEWGAEAFNMYRTLLKFGCPRELARGVLPVNTFSHMFATVDLHNLSHFLKLRLHEHSQYEIRVYAQAMLDLIEPIVPVTVAALKRHVL